ncbi:hypothetical protein JW948_14025 [bacterium]|nr:hypothetical protein [bacterium]
MKRLFGLSICCAILFFGAGHAQMTVKDSNSNILMEVVDEGISGSIRLPSGPAPSSTDGKLYNQGSTLYFSGNELGTAGSAGGWTDDGTVVRLSEASDSVGIGTPSPDSKLEVKGIIHTSSGGVRFPDGSLQTTACGVPVGAIIAWAKNLPGVPSTLPDNFVECNGQTLSDTESSLNGQVIPDLNAANRFLWGHTVSGATGGTLYHNHLASTGDPSTSSGVASGGGTLVAGQHHSHSVDVDDEYHIPPYYTVIWIMRVK